MSGGADRPAGEFELIAQAFAPLAADYPLAFGLLDDAALVRPRDGYDLVATKDAFVAGVHFPIDTAPERISAKLLRVNLSDLAAMGAEPLAYLLATAWPPGTSLDWVKRFADGLKADQKAYGVHLIGGDTVRTSGPMTLSLTALGQVPRGMELRRNGARAGDLLYVSGSIGDGWLGLQSRLHGLEGVAAEDAAYLEGRLDLPEPRLALGAGLRGLATSCIDISDGLAADLGHIAKCSGVMVRIEAGKVPLSGPARRYLHSNPDRIADLLSGGDDYELAFSIPPGAAEKVAALSSELDLPLTQIGVAEEGEGVKILDGRGRVMALGEGGWRHF